MESIHQNTSGYEWATAEARAVSVNWVHRQQPTTWPPVWAIVLILLLALNLKNLPFVWHLRIVNALSYVLRSQRISSKSKQRPGIFDAVVVESLSPLMEIDFNLHKSNSTYFSDVDVARSHLTCSLFNEGIDAARFVAVDGLNGKGHAQLMAMLGSVSCTFKKEIKPYERYQMWSQLLTWDNKWFWVVTWFVTPTNAKEGPKYKVFATAVSKCVFKEARRTIAPATMLGLSNLLPRPGDINAESRMAELERQRLINLDLLNSEQSLDQLHGLFDPDNIVMASRKLDYSLLLIPSVFLLSLEWLHGRAVQALKRSGNFL